MVFVSEILCTQNSKYVTFACKRGKETREWGHAGSYNLVKVLSFNSHLEKSLNLVKVLEKYLISLVGHEKSLISSNLWHSSSVKLQLALSSSKSKVWKDFGFKVFYNA